ncbi:MAG TPA: hypothetical protein VKE96_29370 [Vicinamibacterales bacterium]|nr:hypothetical protein [Vicinamibacterales bacterium]
MTEAENVWRTKGDDEILEAAEELSEYTADGERIIRAELRRRGLPEPGRAIGACPRCGRAIAPNHQGDECGQCGEPLPPDILRALGAASAQSAERATTAKTVTGESLAVNWEVVVCHGAAFSLWRARVPGGWLVTNGNGGLAFVPDADARWNENVS